MNHPHTQIFEFCCGLQGLSGSAGADDASLAGFGKNRRIKAAAERGQTDESTELANGRMDSEEQNGNQDENSSQPCATNPSHAAHEQATQGPTEGLGASMEAPNGPLLERLEAKSVEADTTALPTSNFAVAPESTDHLADSLAASQSVEPSGSDQLPNLREGGSAPLPSSNSLQDAVGGDAGLKCGSEDRCAPY